MTSEDHQVPEIIKDEQQAELPEGISNGTHNLEYLADVAPAVFEEIALCLDRKSIYSLLRTSRIIRCKIQSMMKAKRMDKRILPFRDTTVKITKNYWILGFNTINFYGFTMKAEKEGKSDILQTRKPFGKNKSKEMKIPDLITCLKGFHPKKYIFDINNNYYVLEKHLHVMTQMEIHPGTTTEIVNCMQHFIPRMCVATKPKELILVNPLLNIANEQDYFSDEAFQTVERLRIREYDSTGWQAAQRFNLEPLSENLVSFELTGNLPGDHFPTDQINMLLTKWVENTNPLSEIKVVIGEVDELEPILDVALNGIKYTSVDRINQLPEFMQEKILKDLVGLDWKNANIFYRLILSPSKRQMGCIYYSNAIEPAKVNHTEEEDEEEEFSSYFGFYAFDYFPVKNAPKRR